MGKDVRVGEVTGRSRGGEKQSGRVVMLYTSERCKELCASHSLLKPSSVCGQHLSYMLENWSKQSPLL